MEENHHHELSYSVDDFENADFASVKGGGSGTTPSSQQRHPHQQLQEESVDSYYTNEFEPPLRGGVANGSHSLNEKSYVSEYSQDFPSAEKSSVRDGSPSQNYHQMRSKTESVLSAENTYEDDFLAEKSSLLEPPSRIATAQEGESLTLQENSVWKEKSTTDYGDDFAESSLNEQPSQVHGKEEWVEEEQSQKEKLFLDKESEEKTNPEEEERVEYGSKFENDGYEQDKSREGSASINNYGVLLLPEPNDAVYTKASVDYADDFSGPSAKHHLTAYGSTFENDDGELIDKPNEGPSTNEQHEVVPSIDYADDFSSPSANHHLTGHASTIENDHGEQNDQPDVVPSTNEEHDAVPSIDYADDFSSPSAKPHLTAYGSTFENDDGELTNKPNEVSSTNEQHEAFHERPSVDYADDFSSPSVKHHHDPDTNTNFPLLTTAKYHDSNAGINLEPSIESTAFANHSPAPMTKDVEQFHLIAELEPPTQVVPPPFTKVASLSQLQEYFDGKEDLLIPLPDDHSSVHSLHSKEDNPTHHASIIMQEDAHSQNSRKVTESFDSILPDDHNQIIDQFVTDDPSVYLLEDEEEEQKQNAKENAMLEELSDFVRRNSTVNVLRSEPNSRTKLMSTTTSMIEEKNDDESEHSRGNQYLTEGSRVVFEPKSEQDTDHHDHHQYFRDEENDSVIRENMNSKQLLSTRTDSPDTNHFKQALTDEGMSRVKRLSAVFMNGIFNATLPTDFMKSFKQNLENNAKEIKSVDIETKNLPAPMTSASTVGRESAGTATSLNSGNEAQKTITLKTEKETVLVEYDDNYYEPLLHEGIVVEEEEEEEFFYPPEPDLEQARPIKPTSSVPRSAPPSSKPRQKKTNNNSNNLLDSLERYEAPPPRPSTSSGAMTKQQSSSSRGNSRPNSGSGGGSGGSNAVNQLRNTVESNRKASVREIIASSTTPITKTKTSQFSSEQLSAIKMKEFLNSKPNNPIRFNAKESCLVLTDICIHRRQFARCSSFFCQEGYKKYQWMKLMRKKSKLAMELLENANLLWTKKLQQSLDDALETLQEEQEHEVQIIASKLSMPTTNDKKLFKTLRYMKKHELDKDEHKTIIYQQTQERLTFDDYLFLARQSEIRKDFNSHRKKAILDHLRFEHLKQRDLIRNSIRVPMIYLSRMRRDFLTIITFHKDRVEKSILYILHIALNPKLIHPITISETNLLKHRIYKASLQAFDFLKAGLLMISSICQKIREIYCNSDEQIMQAYLTNYKNPLSEDGNEDEEQEGAGVHFLPRGGSASPAISKLKKNKFSRFYGSFDEEEEAEGGGIATKKRYRRTQSGNPRPSSPNNGHRSSNSPFHRPKTAPAKPTSKGALSSFSPKRTGNDFEAIPLSRNNSYYSDFDEAPSGEENQARDRGDSYSSVVDEEQLPCPSHPNRSGSSVKDDNISQGKRRRSNNASIVSDAVEEDLATVKDDTSAILTATGIQVYDEEQLKPKERSTYSDHDFESPSKSASEGKGRKLLPPVQPRPSTSGNRAGQDKRKKKQKSSNDSTPRPTIITKKDLLIAQMKETKLNTSLLLQDILTENHIPSVSSHSKSYMKSSSLSYHRYEDDDDDENEGNNEEDAEELQLRIAAQQQRRQQAEQQRQSSSSPSKQKKVPCSFCQKTILQQAAKGFPQLINHNDEEIVAKANAFFSTSTNLHKNLENQKATVKREEYLYLYQKLLTKLKYSVRKSSKRYSFVKTMSDGHLSGVQSPSGGSFAGSHAGSFDGSNDGGEVAIEPFSPPKGRQSSDQQQQRQASSKRYKPRHPAPHHDAIFCSYECMKRWTIYYCPVQFKYESEILIDMVAGYSVQV